MTGTSRTHLRRGRCAILTATSAMQEGSTLLVNVLLLCVLFEMTPATFTHMAHATMAVEPPRCHVDYTRYKGRATSKGSWAGLRFDVVFTLGLCTTDSVDSVMSAQLNERHTNITGRSGSVVMPALGLVRFHLSTVTTGPQYFTSQLCYSEVNCTNLWAGAFMGHVSTCKVERTIVPVLIALLWVLPAVGCIGFLISLYVRKRSRERHNAFEGSHDAFRTALRAFPARQTQHCAPLTPPYSSSFSAVVRRSSEAEHRGYHGADRVHASDAPVQVIVAHSEANVSPPRPKAPPPPSEGEYRVEANASHEQRPLAAIPSGTEPAAQLDLCLVGPDERETGYVSFADKEAQPSLPLILCCDASSVLQDMPSAHEFYSAQKCADAPHIPGKQPKKCKCSAPQAAARDRRGRSSPEPGVQEADVAYLKLQQEAAEDAAHLCQQGEGEALFARAVKEGALSSCAGSLCDEGVCALAVLLICCEEVPCAGDVGMALADMNTAPPRPFIGFSLLEDVVNGTLTVNGLYKDGPAYKTGVRLGDTVVRICGVSVHSIEAARLVVGAHCRCGRLASLTLVTKMKQQYTVALWIMTADPQYKGKPFFFDVSKHDRVESACMLKVAKSMDMLESPYTAAAAMVPQPLVPAAPPLHASQLQSSEPSAFVATSNIRSVGRPGGSESGRPSQQCSVATAEATALSLQGHKPLNHASSGQQ
ncbi:hypothetical protein GH5_07936 [Leishmania sp. Ghana 2012 LV757]|uniref:hypothetical protein n=1 Tax=Leishmania sp. Ghana 2012 LV757 TaxID=2803181 RepID=UPI001B56AD90|nr:hypothetical protein GH5_07936 [Leishmania sp. Ghana 2012 LV757]